jgi:hypothetical protein
VCGDEICAADSGNIVLQPLDAIVLFPPFILDISACALEGVRHEHVALAYVSGEPLEMLPKAVTGKCFISLHRFFQTSFQSSRSKRHKLRALLNRKIRGLTQVN